MSDTAQAWVWEHSRTRGTARLVLLALAREAADDGTARMGIATLARLTNATRGAVGDGIAQAVALAELEVREPGAGKRAALYALPYATSYQPVSVRESGTLTPPSVRNSRTLDAPDTPLRPGIRDANRSRPEFPDATPPPSVRESGTLEQQLTFPGDRATRAQASSKAVNNRAGWLDERAPGRPNTVPDFARPLVDAITASQVIVKWNLAEAEWFTLHALIQRSGTDMLAAAAVRAAARADISHARYFLSVWRDLPPAPAAGTAAVTPQQHTGPNVLPFDAAAPRRTRAQRTADELALILAREAAQQ